MVISGLWHGASWTFVIWGALHAVGRVGTRRLEGSAFYRQRVPNFVKRLFVFSFVTFAWIFFRARSLEDAWLVVTRIFQFGWADPRCPAMALGLMLSVWLYQFAYESRIRAILKLAPVRVALVVFMIVYITVHLAVFSGATAKAFIYFQF